MQLPKVKFPPFWKQIPRAAFIKNLEEKEIVHLTQKQNAPKDMGQNAMTKAIKNQLLHQRMHTQNIVKYTSDKRDDL